MSRYIVGLDSGTTSARAKIYDLSGRIVAEASCPYGCTYPAPGWVEQDISRLGEANLTAIRSAVRDSGIDPRDIGSLGLSTQRGLHLYVGRDGEVLRRGMGVSWQDIRHDHELEEMRGAVGEHRFRSTTGLPIAAFWPIGKILWTRRHDRVTFESTAKIVTTQEYFLRQLSDHAEWTIDRSNASLTGLMDVRSLTWSPELLELLEIDESILPVIVGSARRVGAVTEAVRERTGLPLGCPVSTGGGDQQCAAIGAGAVSPGICGLSLGTAGNTVAPVRVGTFPARANLTLSVHATPDPSWESEGIQAAAGASYAWFRHTIAQLDPAMQALPESAVYTSLNELAARSPVGAHGLIYHPYLAGAMTPHYDGHARGGFLGLTLKHGLGDVARAILEGISYETYGILREYARIGIEFDELRLCGGATRLAMWSQVQADIYDIPTVQPREGECAALGAAILGAVGAGIFADVAEGIAATVGVNRVFEPRPHAHARYLELWSIFDRVYDALSRAGVYEALAAAQARTG